jgi:hypothetical protein
MTDEKIHRRPYAPPNPDGFRDDDEDPVAYCPREKKKKTPREHQACEHHDVSGRSEEEVGESAPCDYEEEEAEAEEA